MSNHLFFIQKISVDFFSPCLLEQHMMQKTCLSAVFPLLKAILICIVLLVQQARRFFRY